MMRTHLWWPAVLLVLLNIPSSVPAAGAGAAAYLEGLEALENAKYADAVAAFTKAAAAEEENPDYYTARGVANTLAEKFPDAIKDLQRSLKLRPDSRETKLWLGAAYGMSGDWAKASVYFTHGKDVLADYASFVYNAMAGDYSRNVQQPGSKDAQSVRKQMTRSGAWFAQRNKVSTGDALPKILATRAKERFDQQKYADAMTDLDSVLQANPDDLDALQMHA
jgi:tetratricopeptide (TPR) repeat protein